MLDEKVWRPMDEAPTRCEDEEGRMIVGLEFPKYGARYIPHVLWYENGVWYDRTSDMAVDVKCWTYMPKPILASSEDS